jgi:hypothetical protein
LEPPKPRSLSIFSFQGSFARITPIVATYLAKLDIYQLSHIFQILIWQGIDGLRGSLMVTDRLNPSLDKGFEGFRLTKCLYTPLSAHLHKEDAFISDFFSTNPLDFLLATLTEEVKPNAVLISFDQFI